MANLLLTVFRLSKYLNEQYVQANSCYDTVVCGQIANYQWFLFKGCAYAYLLVIYWVYKESWLYYLLKSWVCGTLTHENANTSAQSSYK